MSYEHLVACGWEPTIPSWEDELIELLDIQRGHYPTDRGDHGPSVPKPEAMKLVCGRLAQRDLVACEGAGKDARWRLTWLGERLELIDRVYAEFSVDRATIPLDDGFVA